MASDFAADRWLLLGQQGFKKAIRDIQLMAQVVIVSPGLLASCALSVIDANGMEALAQLIEYYVSTRQNDFCNVLAEQVIRRILDGLLPLSESSSQNFQVRESMAFGVMVCVC